MKAGTWIFLLLGMSGTLAAQPVETSSVAKRSLSGEVLRAQISELVKADAQKSLPKTKESVAATHDPIFNEQHQPLPDDVWQMEPFTVTKKREIELPTIPRLTLENFFYGDGTIARKGRVSLSAGPERRGLAALKLNIKF